MDPHSQFKVSQTAAKYVAHGLDEETTEAFEMHMMECRECTSDVEAWRAIGRHIVPQRSGRSAQTRWQSAPWRLAAAVLIAFMAGAGGWLARAVQAPEIDARQTVFFNVPALTRGGPDCMALHLAPGSRTAVLRIAGVSRDRRIILVDLLKHEIPASRYTSWQQPDGSHVLRLDAAWLAGNTLSLEARTQDGLGEPLGCVTGAASAAP
jgi:hypothetical protein